MASLETDERSVPRCGVACDAMPGPSLSRTASSVFDVEMDEPVLEAQASAGRDVPSTPPPTVADAHVVQRSDTETREEAEAEVRDAGQLAPGESRALARDSDGEGKAAVVDATAAEVRPGSPIPHRRHRRRLTGAGDEADEAVVQPRTEHTAGPLVVEEEDEGSHVTLAEEEQPELCAAGEHDEWSELALTDEKSSPGMVTLLGAPRDLRRKRIKRVSHYILGPLLGEGAYGVVRDGIDVSGEGGGFERCAVKIVAMPRRNSGLQRPVSLGRRDDGEEDEGELPLLAVSEAATGARAGVERRGEGVVGSLRPRLSREDRHATIFRNELRNLQRFHCRHLIRAEDVFSRYGKEYVVMPIAVCTLEQLVEQTKCVLRRQQRAARAAMAAVGQRGRHARRMVGCNANGSESASQTSHSLRDDHASNCPSSSPPRHPREPPAAAARHSRHGAAAMVAGRPLRGYGGDGEGVDDLASTTSSTRTIDSYTHSPGHNTTTATGCSTGSSLMLEVASSPPSLGPGLGGGHRDGLAGTSAAPGQQVQPQGSARGKTGDAAGQRAVGPGGGARSEGRGAQDTSPHTRLLHPLKAAPDERVMGTSAAIAGSAMQARTRCGDGNVALFAPTLIKGLMYQILTGVAYLHRQNIAHNDIKPANILLFESGTVALSDLGSVGEEYDDQGTPLYAAPELCTRFYGAATPEKGAEDGDGNKAASGTMSARDDGDGAAIDAKAADMWCCGLVLYYLITGHVGPLPVHRRHERQHPVCGSSESDDEAGSCHGVSHMRHPRHRHIDAEGGDDGAVLTRFQLYRQIAHEATQLSLADLPDLAGLPLPSTGPANTSGSGGAKEASEQMGDGTAGKDVATRLYRPDGVRHLLAALLEPDPARRMTAREALRHPWVAISFRTVHSRHVATPTTSTAALSSFEDLHTQASAAGKGSQKSREAGGAGQGKAIAAAHKAMEDAIERDVARRVLQSAQFKRMLHEDRLRHLQFVADCCNILNIPLPPEIIRAPTAEPYGPEDTDSRYSYAALEVSRGYAAGRAGVEGGLGGAGGHAGSRAGLGVVVTGTVVPFGLPRRMPAGCVDPELFLPHEEEDYYENKGGKAEFDVRCLRSFPKKVRQMEEYLRNVVMVQCGYRTEPDPAYAVRPDTSLATLSARGIVSGLLTASGADGSSGPLHRNQRGLMRSVTSSNGAAQPGTAMTTTTVTRVDALSSAVRGEKEVQRTAAAGATRSSASSASATRDSNSSTAAQQGGSHRSSGRSGGDRIAGSVSTRTSNNKHSLLSLRPKTSSRSTRTSTALDDEDDAHHTVVPKESSKCLCGLM